MKKTLIIVLVLVLSLGTATMALADDNGAAAQPWKAAAARIRNMPKLVMSDEQKTEMTSLMTQMLELRKQIVKSNVDNGTITAEQGQLMQERIGKRIEAVKSGDFKPGMGRGGRRGGPQCFSPQFEQNQATRQ